MNYCTSYVPLRPKAAIAIICLLRWVLAAAFVFSSLSLASAQTVLYSENFNFPGGNGSTNTAGLNSAYGTNASTELTNGWAGFASATATDQSPGAVTSIGAIAIADRQSPSGPSSGANQYGVLIDSFDNNSILATTPTGLSIDTADQNLTFQWIQGDNAASDQVSLAIKLDNGQWYVGTAAFSTAPQGASTFASLSTTGETKTVVFAAAASNWKLLTFTPNSQLAVGGAPSSPLSGHIVGFGFFLNNVSNTSSTKNNLRFDQFQITTTSTISIPPSITSQPVGATVTAGQSPTFSVTATNNPTGYQWYFNSSMIAGATASSYTVNSAQASNAGTYYVMVSNASGSVQSNGVVLTVNPVLNGSSPLSAFVNPFIGTANSGDTFPGATSPQGFVQFSPDTYPTDIAGGYYYGDNSIRSFSVDHFSGRGSTYETDIGFMPVVGSVTQSPAANPSAFLSTFSHGNESASAGYYKVLLDSGPKVELSVTPRTGMMQLTYPASATKGSLIINIGNSVNGVSAGQVNIINGNEVTGWAQTRVGGGSGIPTYIVYFSAVFDQPIQNQGFGVWNGGSLVAGGTAASGGNTGAYVTFDTSTNKVVHVKVGVSWVSIANAQLNRTTENSGWDFAGVKTAAAADWNSVLNSIVINDASVSADTFTVFYTALYHTLLHENIFDDVNGQYIGFDGLTHTVASGHHHYTNIPGWDHYRSHSPLMALLFPNEYSDVAQSLIDDANQTPAPHTGQVPRWVQENCNSNGMVGDGNSIAITNAYAFGARNFDTAAGLAVVVNSASAANALRSVSGDWQVGSGLPGYLQYGYIPDHVSVTLEYAITDMAVAQYALALGRADLYGTYAARAGNWQNLFNPGNLTISSRDSFGNWDNGINNGLDVSWVEGSQAQYTWMLPFNLRGLFDAMGGNAAVVSRLDNFFSQLNAGTDAPYEYIGNEPGESQPWSYLYAGVPWKTQALNRQIELQQFSNSFGGIPGNDDAGATSSWYIFATLGLYPMTSGVGDLVIGSPLFASATLTMEGGQVLQINGTNAGAGNPYVQSLNINGAPTTKLWLPVSTILGNSLTTLTFNLSNTPNASWGIQTSDAPPSFGNAATLISATSEQVQGSAKYDLPLALTVPATIEPREGTTMGTYSLILTFSSPVSGITASLGLQANQSGSVLVAPGATAASAGTPIYDSTGTVVTLPITGIGNGQRINVHLSGIQPGNGTADIPLNILWGDVNQNGVVSSSDVNLVRSNSGAPVSAQNNLEDVNCNGVISSSDVNIVRSLSGSVLP